jgi:hypothetical protein
MIIYRDEERIEKLKKRSRRISLAGFLIMASGLIAYFLAPSLGEFNERDVFLYETASLIVGFGLVQYGLYLQHRYVRSPRPDEVLDDALKSVGKDSVLYHYILPAPQVLLTPAGPIVFVLKYQTGIIRADGDKWSQKGLGFRRFFGQEGLGNPTKDAEKMVKALYGFISRQAPEIRDEELTILSIIVFTSKNRDELDVSGSDIPAMHYSKVKGFLKQLKQQGKWEPLPQAQYDALRGAFDEAAGDLVS